MHHQHSLSQHEKETQELSQLEYGNNGQPGNDPFSNLEQIMMGPRLHETPIKAYQFDIELEPFRPPKT